jgi:hypothetical protein
VKELPQTIVSSVESLSSIESTICDTMVEEVTTTENLEPVALELTKQSSNETSPQNLSEALVEKVVIESPEVDCSNKENIDSNILVCEIKKAQTPKKHGNHKEGPL